MTLIVDLNQGWCDKATVSEITKQASKEARSKVYRLVKDAAEIRIERDIKVTQIITVEK